jgi:hypothetical protein
VDVRTEWLLSGPYRTSAEQFEEQAEAQLHGQITPMGGSAGFIIYDAGGLSFLECVGNANRPLGSRIQHTAHSTQHAIENTRHVNMVHVLSH